MSDSKDKELREDKLPTVSGPAPKHRAALRVPRPQIKGYRIISEIGAAGQGRVWRALQLSTNREVALKVPQAVALTSEKALLRFEREVELAARLKHPNIAGIYDSGIYHGLYYYAMELLDGVPLDQYVQESSLSQRHIVELMHTICQAVQHAHQNGVIHRDIKPSNIVVTKDGQPHIVDFGLAMTVRDEDKFKTISTDGELTGTPAYMSPEQVAGKHDSLDTRTDVYSIGVVFYKGLTNQFPYDVRSTMLKTLQHIQEQEPVRPSKITPHIDRDIEAIVLKALAKDPSQRYQSASELAQDMGRWLNGLPIVARSSSSLYLLRKVINKHRYSTAIVALLMVIVFGYLSVVLQLYGRLRRSNSNLEAVTDSLMQQLDQTRVLVHKGVFDWILLAWHEGDNSRVNFLSTGFKGSREDVAIQFMIGEMLDETPLDNRLEALRNQLGRDEVCFYAFIVGEYWLKHSNKDEAIKAFTNCMSHRDKLEQDRWLSMRVRSRLYELVTDEPALRGSSPEEVN